MLSELIRQELSPSITVDHFDLVSSLRFYVSLVLFVCVKSLALLLLEVQHCLAGGIINACCHILVSIQAFD